MKVIFLDIDGVMNCQNEMLELLKTNCRADVTLPSPAKCKLLKRLIDKTDAKIVLSSSWRLSLTAIQKVLDSFDPYGLTISGFTCHEVLKSKFKNTSYIDITPKHTHIGWEYNVPNNEGIYIEDRGAEIAAWLLDHPKVTTFVILDDDAVDIEQWFPNNLVQTDLKNGLTEEHIEKCIDILNKDERKESYYEK